MTISKIVGGGSYPPGRAIKICKRCNETKPIEQFNWRDKKRGITQSYCKPCQSAYTRDHYRRNPGPYRSRAAITNSAARITTDEYISRYLSSHPCIDCGETDPIVLEFDHRERATKKYVVSRLRTSYRFGRLIAEIEKCDVRCANCHRRKTALEQGWYKYRTEA